MKGTAARIIPALDRILFSSLAGEFALHHREYYVPIFTSLR